MNSQQHLLEQQFETPEQLEQWLGLFAKQLHAGDVLYLRGPVGTGKTFFVRALTAALGGDWRDVASPTYGLVHVYPTATAMLVHADLYRLRAAQEVVDLDFDQFLEQTIICIEWPEQGEGFLPPATINIELKIPEPVLFPTRRLVRVQMLDAARAVQVHHIFDQQQLKF